MCPTLSREVLDTPWLVGALLSFLALPEMAVAGEGGGANLSGVVFLEALGSELADVVGWGCLRAEHMWASSLGGSGSGEGKVLGGSWKVPGEVGGLEVHQPLQKPAVTGTQGSHLVPPTPGGLNWGQEQAA